MLNAIRTSAAVNWIHRIAPDRYVSVRVLRGALRARPMLLNLRYQMGYWLGLTESDLQEALRAVVSPGDVVYDVGAEVGYFSLLAAEFASPGIVYAFEPNPHNISVLKENARRNPDLNVTVVPKAVGGVQGRVEFVTFGPNDRVPNASLLGRLAEIAGPGERGTRVSVDMIDLDSFSAQNRASPAVVKIDVEGAEGLVLEGMTQLLASAKPRLVIEIHNAGAERDVRARLAENYYESATIGRTFTTDYPFRLLCMPQ